MWAGDIIDICKGTAALFADALGVPVIMGYQDERAASDASFPTGVLTVYDYRHDPGRRSGLMHTHLGDGVNGSVERVKTPIPMNLYMQLDTLSESRAIDQQLMMAAQSVLQQRHAKIITPDGEELYLIPFQQDALDSVVDSVWRKIYRFYVETWLEPYGVSETIPTLIDLQVVLNTVTIELPPPRFVQPRPRTLVTTGINPTISIT